jgi:hypothetical protein
MYDGLLFYKLRVDFGRHKFNKLNLLNLLSFASFKLVDIVKDITI